MSNLLLFFQISFFFNHAKIILYLYSTFILYFFLLFLSYIYEQKLFL